MYGRVLVEITLPGELGSEEIIIHEYLLNNGYTQPYEGKTKQKMECLINSNLTK